MSVYMKHIHVNTTVLILKDLISANVMMGIT